MTARNLAIASLPNILKTMAQSEFKRLCFFASLLGWEGLQQFRHRMDADVMLAPGEDPVIRWFECEAMTNLTLQINTAPTYGAAVFAIRYRIASGWYEFTLPSSKREAQREAQRLAPLLHRDWFRTPEKRRE